MVLVVGVVAEETLTMAVDVVGMVGVAGPVPADVAGPVPVDVEQLVLLAAVSKPVDVVRLAEVILITAVDAEGTVDVVVPVDVEVVVCSQVAPCLR